MGLDSPFTSILHILQEYKQVTVGFLADQMSMSRKSTEAYLARLEDRGVVEREGSTIRLVDYAEAEEESPEP